MSVRSKKLWEPSPRKPSSWTSRCCCFQWKPCFFLLTPGIAILLQAIDCVSSLYQEDLYKFERMQKPTPTHSWFQMCCRISVINAFVTRLPHPAAMPASHRKGARKRRKATSPCLVKAGREVTWSVQVQDMSVMYVFVEMILLGIIWQHMSLVNMLWQSWILCTGLEDAKAKYP